MDWIGPDWTLWVPRPGLGFLTARQTGFGFSVFGVRFSGFLTCEVLQIEWYFSGIRSGRVLVKGAAAGLSPNVNYRPWQGLIDRSTGGMIHPR